MKRACHLVVVAVLGLSHPITSRAAGELIPRTLPPKPPTISNPPYESQLTVKFCDDLKAQAGDASQRSLRRIRKEGVQRWTTNV